MEILENLGIEAVPAIVVIAFLIGLIVKRTPLDDMWIPCICGFCGGVLGLVAMFISPEFPTHDPIMAVAVGIFSGLAATGLHQVYKQLTKGSGDTVEVTAEEYNGKH